jgi:hypothetical protein
LQALGESWNEFMRTPQFQENMKQWMDNALSFRKMSHDFMAKVHNEMQTPSRDDIDVIMQNARHLETRILDRLEELSKQIEGLNHRTPPASSPAREPNGRPGPAQSKKQKRNQQRTS